VAIERFTFDEKSAGSIEFDIYDRDGEPVPVAGILTAELTLYDWDTGAGGGSPHPGIINNRDGQDVLNLNDVTLSDSPTVGHVLWDVQPEDNPIVTNRREVERHRAMFLFAWSGGEFRKELELLVRNLRLHP
jgi:hypothetical protein